MHEGVVRSGARRAAVLALLALLSAVAADRALAQDGEEDPGLTITADAVSIDFTGRVQTQLATSSCSDFPFEPDSPCVEQASGLDVFMRRVRFAAVVTLLQVERGDETVPFLTAKVEPDFGDVNDVVLRDAYGRLTFSDHAKVQIGQFKRPFDGFNLVSSSKLLTVERDLDVPGVPGLRAASLGEFTSRFNLGSYDVGAMISGEAADGRVEYWVGAFNGEPSGANNDRNADKQFSGRLQYNLDVDGLPLSVAGAATATDLPFEDVDDQEGLPRSGEYYYAYEVFAELGEHAPGPQVQAGLIFGDNPLQNELGGAPAIAGDADPDFAGMMAWQTVGAYRFAVPGTPFVEGVEPAFRVTRADPNTDLDDDETWGFTPGVNIYFHGRNKLQLDWDVVTFAGDTFETVSSFKSQFQVYF